MGISFLVDLVPVNCTVLYLFLCNPLITFSINQTPVVRGVLTTLKLTIIFGVGWDNYSLTMSMKLIEAVGRYINCCDKSFSASLLAEVNNL